MLANLRDQRGSHKLPHRPLDHQVGAAELTLNSVNDVSLTAGILKHTQLVRPQVIHASDVPPQRLPRPAEIRWSLRLRSHETLPL